MTDPAIEAAERVCPPSDDSTTAHAIRSVAEAGAREALKPIRELHRPCEGSVSAMYPDPLCGCGADFPCDTAKLIYTTEELER